MHLRAFEPADLAVMNEWLFKRGLTAVPGTDVPKLGLIVPNLGMVFLRLAEGGLGIIEGLVANPDAIRQDRDEALELLFAAILAVAEKQGCSRVWGLTINTGAYMRATQHGFQLSPCVLLVKE